MDQAKLSALFGKAKHIAKLFEFTALQCYVLVLVLMKLNIDITRKSPAMKQVVAYIRSEFGVTPVQICYLETTLIQQASHLF